MEKINYSVNAESTSTQLKIISLEELGRIAPKAFTTVQSQIIDDEEQDIDPIWIMTEKPVLLPRTDDLEDETWSQTNEPELAERIAEGWDDYTVTFNGQKFVILCGSYDDEYGWLWNEKSGEWENYMY